MEAASEVMARWVTGTATPADERDLFDAGEITECEFEFGPHEEHEDCGRILADMSSGWDDGPWVEAYNRELEAESLGRPLFPNEY